ncbi:MAG: hypothetical protein GY726_11155 [Proteobacteria bacterium]|nr:hypothetical protein [Pseudomonadota bacterium]
MRSKQFGLLCLMCAFGVHGPALAETPGSDPTAAMQALYERVRSTLDNPTPENPFYLDASSTEETESGEAAVYLPLSLDEVASALGPVSNWCNIMPLHINVKTCTYNQAGDLMNLYMGRKFYQTPDDAFELTYRFKTHKSDNYFAAIAHAEKGPLKTSDYQIKLEFISIDGKTFARIFVSNQQSWMSRKGMEVYLSTLGKGKRGIKVINLDKQGEPVYSNGAIGVAERNLVRYYFAFMTFFNSSVESGSAERYEHQLNDWFDRTETYPQLYEMSRQEYLDSKRKERENQLVLQKTAFANK